MKLTKFKAVLTASILLSFIIFVSGCGQQNEIVKDVPTVKVMELKKTSLTVTVDYPAKLLPFQDIDVSARIPGKVSDVYFNVGSKVKKGDILFTLEAEESNSQLSQSKAALIRAPIDGVVSICNVKAGEMTSGAINAFTIINSDDLSAEINVPGEVQSVLSIGQILKFEIGVNEEKELDGTVSTVSPAADPRTGFFNVKIILKNGDGALKPGMFAKAVVPTKTRNDVITVPGGAIVSENGIEFVYLIQDGIVVKKIVKTGASTDTATEISGDLKEGYKIILEGQSFLSEGEKVEAVNGGNV